MTLPKLHLLGWIVASRLTLVLVAWLGAAHVCMPGMPVSGTASGLRLIMVEEPGCRFCRRWNAEVGIHYEASAQGRIAPLVRVGRSAKELSGHKPVIYTPTFILERDGMEIGRIPGYPGEAFFWEELDQLLVQARGETSARN
jgi:hypothetical protein